jgi:hypothetical protein
MKRAVLLVVTVLLLAVGSLAQAVKTPSFSKYPSAVEKPRVKSVDFRHDAGARSYRTRLTEAFRGGVNFAGHYIITGWGCGTGCTNGAVIDTRNGKVIWPVQLYNLDASYGEGYSDKQIDFRKNSRLIIIHGRPGTGDENSDAPPSGDYYYEWRNNRFRLLKFVEKRSE